MSRFGESGDDSDDDHDESDSTESQEDQKPNKTELRGWKDKILHKLDAIEKVGDFAVAHHHAVFVNPGLVVNQEEGEDGKSIEDCTEPIPLPLARRDAELLKRRCRQAPFGRGDETVVDTSVRHTWELDHSQFRITNPAWKAFFDGLLADVAQSLGMVNVRAEPYKLLLYEEGSFFKRHKDSEKVSGMVGTLVICLPSKHDGGDVRLSHSGQNRVFSTSKSSAFDLTVLGWYSDVTHEILKLISGYRLVLTYNLIQTEGRPLGAGFFEQQYDEIRRQFAPWQSRFPRVKRLLYFLDHKYTESSLSLQNMKGHDRAVCQILEKFCSENGYLFLLGNVTLEDEEDYDSYYSNGDASRELRLDCVHSSDGHLIPTHADKIRRGDIINRNPYNDRDPDSEDEEQFTGNESMIPARRYHDTVAMLVSKAGVSSLLVPPAPAGMGTSGSERSSTAALFGLVKKLLGPVPQNPTSQSLAIEIIDVILPATTDDAMFASMASWAVGLERRDMFHKITRQASQIGLTKLPGLTRAICAPIQQCFQSSSTPANFPWQDWLSGIIDSMAGLTRLQSNLNQLMASFSRSDVKDSLRKWASGQVETQLCTKKLLDMADLGFIVAKISSQQTSEEYRGRIISRIVGHADRRLFFTLLGILLDPLRNVAIPDAKSIASHLIFSTGTFSRFTLQYSHIVRPSNLDPEAVTNLFGFIDKALAAEMANEVRFVLDATCEGILSTFPTAAHPASYDGQRNPVLKNRPVELFLSSLADTLYAHRTSEPPPSARILFEALYRRHFLPDLPAYPQRLPGWQRRPRGCSDVLCGHCALFRQFLMSPTEQEFHFRAAQPARDHVQRYAPSGLFRCRVVKDRSPHLLIITKVGDEFEHDIGRYNQALFNHLSDIKVFMRSSVEWLLGHELYRELVLLENVPGIGDVPKPVVVGVKRSADDPS